MLTYTTHKIQWRQSFLVHLLPTSNNVILTDAINTHTNIKRASYGNTHIQIYMMGFLCVLDVNDTDKTPLLTLKHSHTRSHAHTLAQFRIE